METPTKEEIDKMLKEIHGWRVLEDWEKRAKKYEDKLFFRYVRALKPNGLWKTYKG